MNNINPYFVYIFPVVTLILGIVLNRLADHWISKKKMKKKGQRWVIELQFLQKPMEKQVQALQVFLAEHTKDEFSTPHVSGFVLMKTERFKSLDRMDFASFMEYKFGSEEKAIEKTNEVLGMVEVIDTYAKRIEEVFNTYKTTASTHFGLWHNGLNDFIRKFIELQTEGEKKGNVFEKDKLLFPLYPIISNVLEDNKTNKNVDVFAFHKTVLMPVLKICEQQRHDERSDTLRTSIIQCHDATQKIRLEKSYLSENMEKIIEAIGKAKTRLNELVTEIKKS